MGEIFYEKGKKYNCRVKGVPYFRTSVTVQGKVKSIYGDGEKDAKRKKEELLSAASSGLDITKKDAKTGDIFKHWLYDIKRIDKDLKSSSFARYDCIYRNHIEPYEVMKTTLSKLTSSKLQVYFTDLYETHHCSNSTIANVLKVWRMFTDWAMEEGYLTKNPCKNITIAGKYDRKKRKIEVFEPEERTALLDYMERTGYKYDTIIRLAFATGMRLGELLGLSWDDITDDSISITTSTGIVSHVDKNGNHNRYREIWEPKTENSVRIIPLLPSTKAMLDEHRENQQKYFKAHKLGKPEFVFTTSTGELIDPSSFSKSYRRLLNRAGVPYRKFHTIRHTFATEAIRRGVDVKDLQMLMGHSELETTYIYVQVDEKSKRRAIDKMGEII